MRTFFHPELFEEFKDQRPESTAFNPSYRYKEDDNSRYQEALKSIAGWHGHKKWLADRKGETQRSKQQKVIEKQQIIVESILANFLLNERKALTLSLSKRTLDKKDRYRPKWLTYPLLRETLQILTSPEIDIIKLRKGETVQVVDINWDEETSKETLKGIPSTIELTKRGHTFIDTMSPEYAHTERAETIHLRQNKSNGRNVNIQYEDTRKTIKMRSEMAIINDYLKDLLIEHFDEGLLPRSSLYRIFKNKFKTEGRLYGGAWYTLNKKTRLDMTVGRRTNNKAPEAVIELDFKACGLSITYNMQDKPLDPNKDPYQSGSLSNYNREAVKDLINAYLNKPSMTRFPKGFSERFNKGKSSYEDVPQAKISLGHVLQDIFEVHPILKQIDKPVDTQFIDSQIVVKVMLKAIKDNLTVFPLHDAFFVAESDVEKLERIVNEVTAEVTGYPMHYVLKKYDTLRGKEVTVTSQLTTDNSKE